MGGARFAGPAQLGPARGHTAVWIGRGNGFGGGWTMGFDDAGLGAAEDAPGASRS